jgi:hypothetical protein
MCGPEFQALFAYAPVRRLEISLSQGAEWKALISRYIETIPLSGDGSCVAEQSATDGPPPTPASSAMIAKVGAAARDRKPAALAATLPLPEPIVPEMHPSAYASLM